MNHSRLERLDSAWFSARISWSNLLGLREALTQLAILLVDLDHVGRQLAYLAQLVLQAAAVTLQLGNLPAQVPVLLLQRLVLVGQPLQLRCRLRPAASAVQAA